MMLLVATATAAFDGHGEAEFLWVSDIHFNPMADPSLVSELEKAEPAQWESILNRSSSATFSQYKSDTNWWLLRSALEQFPKTLRHPAFVMVTGDLLAHDFPKTFEAATHDQDERHYRAFVQKTVEFLALELRGKFPGTKIFLTPGNNDNDCGDYTIEAGGVFLRDTADVARRLASGDEAFVSDWRKLGSFNVAHPTVGGMHILSLNSIFWSQKYVALSSSEGCKPVSTNAPADLMQWLEQQLEAAKAAHERVWLMFHIPPGIDGYASAMKRKGLAAEAASAETCSQSIVPMWATQWTAQFDALLGKYHDTVVASFAAHTHSDDFRVIGQKGDGREFVVMSPAISPIYGQNPGYRVVRYRGDGRVKDQSTYYLTNLADASAKEEGRWKREYTYTKKWKARELSAASLSNLYDEVATSDRVREDWLKLYAVSGPALEGERPIVRALYCSVEGLSVDSYRECWCGGRQ